MKIRRPSHATVVACLALFAATGSGAYAASKIGTNEIRDGAVTSAKIKNGNVKAADLKRPIIRVVRRPGQVGGSTFAQARCKRNERLIGGGGGWDNPASSTITFSAPDSKRVPPAPATDYAVTGQTSIANTLEARALCLPK